jgi:hypothetical protein
LVCITSNIHQQLLAFLIVQALDINFARTSKSVIALPTIEYVSPPGLSKEYSRENASDWLDLCAVALNVVACLGKRFNCILPPFTLAMASESEWAYARNKYMLKLKDISLSEI